jgi:hypothetical protein
MRGRLGWILFWVYLLLLAFVVLKAGFKWGPAWALWFLLIGLGLLLPLWRIWLMLRFVLFGGPMPWVAVSQGTDFLPPTKNKKWAPPP